MTVQPFVHHTFHCCSASVVAYTFACFIPSSPTHIDPRHSDISRLQSLLASLHCSCAESSILFYATVFTVLYYRNNSSCLPLLPPALSLPSRLVFDVMAVCNHLLSLDTYWETKHVKMGAHEWYLHQQALGMRSSKSVREEIRRIGLDSMKQWSVKCFQH